VDECRGDHCDRSITTSATPYSPHLDTGVAPDRRVPSDPMLVRTFERSGGSTLSNPDHHEEAGIFRATVLEWASTTPIRVSRPELQNGLFRLL